MANILIVDDVIDVRKSILRTLKNFNYTLFEASNGLEALDILKKNKIDLMILDILMPEKGGIDTLLDLKKNNSDIKIIIITGLDLPKNSAATRLMEQFGTKKILIKPFKGKALIDAINNVLKN